MKTAKATRGFKRVVVSDCPYCHREHSHSESELDKPRMAGCLEGEYILDFTQESEPPDTPAPPNHN